MQQDLSGLQKQIDRLDLKIDQGADRVLDAPSEIVPTLYRKIEQFRAERGSLASRLQDLAGRRTRSADEDKAEIERAIATLRQLGEAFTRAAPSETKELLDSVVTKVELHFTDGTGRKKRDFTHGTIYLRPDAGGGYGLNPSPEVTHLSIKRTVYATRNARLGQRPPANCCDRPSGEHHGLRRLCP